jgi:hypothetical protein
MKQKNGIVFVLKKGTEEFYRRSPMCSMTLGVSWINLEMFRVSRRVMKDNEILCFGIVSV